jgi:protein-tyrosine phosphatase
VSDPAVIRVCFVCLGNICRSPTAEGVMLKLVADAGLQQRLTVASAGTGAYHVGEPADRRSSAEARSRGIELTGRARQFEQAHFDDYDYVVAMDSRNLKFLKRMARHPEDHAKLALLRSFDAMASDHDVPDPYFEDNFDVVFDICHAGCTGLLAHIRAQHGL